MNRRVLLIDGDSAFRETLSRELGRYRVVVMTEADAERALALATSDPPDMIVIAVEEPEKQGFKTFQKARKTMPAKMPVMLVTSSLPPESFAKHRGMKVHADEYLDKRDLVAAELVQKVDALVGLGEPEPEDDGIPVADDIPMELADGDVVLDEQLDDDDVGSFANDDKKDMATINPHSEVLVDRMVAQETDAAFDALLGDAFGGGDPVAPEPAATIAEAEPPVEVEAAPEPVPEPVDAEPEPIEAAPVEAAPQAVDAVEDSGIPEPVPHKIPDDLPEDAVPVAATADLDSVPSPIRDGGRETSDHIETSTAAEVVRAASVHEDDFAEEDAPVAIADDDLVSLDDDVPLEEVAADEAEDRGERTMIAQAPAAMMAMMAEPARAKTPTAAPEPIPAQTSDRNEKSGARAKSVDLGLDSVAKSVEQDREASGVYDHKGLRKIGELERQIEQLKTELDKARANADAAAKGNREAQFLNLREQNLAKEKELKDAKAALEAQAKDLAEANEKLRQAQHAKEKLQKQNEQLEEKIFNGKERELEETLKEVSARLTNVERELEAKSKAVLAAETALAQLERDLASERASGAASASESERKLRMEREQMIARHKGELAALKAEQEVARDQALEHLREDLESAHAVKLEESLEELRRANAQEHTEAVEAIEHKHSAELVNLKAEHAGELTRIKSELAAKVSELEAQLATATESHAVAIAGAEQAQARAFADLEAKHKDELAEQQRAAAERQSALQHELETARAKFEAELEAAQDEASEARERDAESHGQAIAQLKAQLDRAVAAHEVKLGAATRELQALAEQHEAALAALAQQHESALAELRAKHETELGQLSDGSKRAAETHLAALAEQQQKFDAQLAELSENAQREIAEQRGAVHAAKKAAEEAAARFTAEREELQQAHASQIGELEAKHERALAVVNGEALEAKAVADADHAKQVAALAAEADTKLRELEAAHAATVAELTAERDELTKGLSGARDSLKRSEAELAAAVQTIADRNADLRAHAQAIAERDQRIAELRAEIESIEGENASYQEQVLRAYQKIKTDEAMVARARKAMAIALTVLDDQGNPTATKPET